MRILMIGGSGYVGSLMLPALAARHELRVLDPLAPQGAHDHITGSALDPAALATALSGTEAVVHAAMGRRSETDWPFPDLPSAFEVNVASVYATLAAAHEANVNRVVLIGSMSVFSNDPVRLPDRRLDETHEPDATDLYGVTKRLAEQVGRIAAEAHDLTVTVLRLSWPTPDDAWPRWALPVEPEPVQITRADGTPFPALAGSDLASAVEAALTRTTGGFEVFHIHGEDSQGRWTTAKARDQLGWVPKRR